jgi:hypothetical protein
MEAGVKRVCLLALCHRRVIVLQQHESSKQSDTNDEDL